MALRGGLLLLVSAISMGQACTTPTVIDSPANTAGGERVPNSTPLFSQPQIVTRVAYSAAGLTYVPSDMGPERAILPDPVFLSPELGLWVIDRGANSASWRLIRIDPGGQVRYSVNLVEKLGLKAPNEFIPVGIHADSKGNLNLVASRSFDFVLQSQKEFFCAVFSAEGNLVGSRMLPGFRFDGRLFFLSEGSLANWEKSNGGTRWVLYAGKGEKRELAKAGVGETAAQMQRQILELTANKEFEAISDDGRTVKLALLGPAPQGDPVTGEGSFFGTISLDPFAAGEKPKELVQPRMLQLLFCDAKAAAVYNVGNTPLRPNVSTEDSSDFVLHRPGNSRFDGRGNLYEIAWSPSALSVYRYNLDRPRFEELLREIR